MGFSRIFRSRWSALFWAGGVLWTAYDIADANTPAHQAHNAKAKATATMTDATGTPVDQHDLAALANAIGD